MSSSLCISVFLVWGFLIYNRTFHIESLEFQALWVYLSPQELDQFVIVTIQLNLYNYQFF